MILTSLFGAVAIYIVMLKLGVVKLFQRKSTRRVADGGLDLAVSAGLVMLFAGTFSGMVTGIITGLFVSGFLFLTRAFTKVKSTKRVRIRT